MPLIGLRGARDHVAVSVPAAVMSLRGVALPSHVLAVPRAHVEGQVLVDVVELAGLVAQGPQDPEKEAPDSNNGDPSQAGG